MICRVTRTHPENESEQWGFLAPLNFFAALNAMANLFSFEVVLPEFIGVLRATLLGEPDFGISANLCRVQAD